MLELARGANARSIFVVGIGRDVGKTTTLRAIYDAACAGSLSVGLASCGIASSRKPQLWLKPETVFVTARDALPRTPAVEILRLSPLPTAGGRLLYARVAAAGKYELAGPPTASGVSEVVDDLCELSEMVIIDGAVDRVAALAGAKGAIVVACGAAAAKTMPEAVDEISSLVARLSIPPYDPAEPAIQVDGALTASSAAALIAARERRQIVVRDPTQIAFSGKAGSRALERLRVRCHRPLRVIAATIASTAPERTFEPRAFARAVADATGLPTFDVYASARAA
ncbi:MAG: hypothetical protein JO146_05265 [Candidatus Eremiobacteraeota bacterium]|nr:hypothetical protein [Candidatus Eremiobacteraeota bacterium]